MARRGRAEEHGSAIARSTPAAYDYIFFFSYRYFHAYHGVRATPTRAILVPTAERDEAVGLAISPRIFRGVRALMYNSPEERRMIQAVSDNHDVSGVVVGIGSEISRRSSRRERFRQKYGIAGPFALYVGRIDQNKGCRELFTFYLNGLQALPKGLRLVLIGKALLPIPDHPRIHHFGFLDDQDKFDALAAADLLVMPSYYESLSMVALEAWAVGKPVLANGKCEVLRGQCIRSKAGLYYEKQAEFIETLRTIAESRTLNAALRRKRSPVFPAALFVAGHRTRSIWRCCERLKEEDDDVGMPDPGSRARSRGSLQGAVGHCRPATEVLADLPSGPVLSEQTGSKGPVPN